MFAETNAFSITGTITLSAASTAIVGTNYPISWTTVGNLGSVILEYSPAGQNQWNLIATTNSTSGFTWTIPYTLGGNFDIRARSSLDADITSTVSAITLSRIRVSAPTEGQVLQTGTTASFSFGVDQSISAVDLLLSEDNGTTFPTTLASDLEVTAGVNTYNWTVPDVYANEMVLKVQASGAPEHAAESSAFVTAGSLAITAPTVGTVFLRAEQNREITWSTTGTSVEQVRIEVSVNNGSSWTTLVNSMNNTGSYAGWSIPDVTTTTARVRISAIGQPEVVATSAAFSIAQNVAITAPAAGATLTAGTATTIAFYKPASVVSVDLYFAADGENYEKINGAPLVGTTFSWTPTVKTETGKLRVLANTPNDARFVAESGVFTVRGSVVVTSVGPQASYLFDEDIAIQLQLSGTMAVTLAYLSDADGFTQATPIPGSELTQHSATSYTWRPTTKIGTQFRVRATDAADAAVFGTSSTLSIGRAKIIAPTAAASPGVGEEVAVQWAVASGIDSVLVQYYPNGTTTYTTITTVPANSLTTNWQVPGSISGLYNVRLLDADTQEVLAVSQSFQVRGALNFTTNFATTSFARTQNATLTWDSSGAISSVVLEYKALSQDNWSTIATTANTGSFTWTNIPVGKGQYVLRVRDAGNAAVVSTSPTITIQGMFTALAVSTTNQPTAAFTPTEKVTITWGSTNPYLQGESTALLNVKIEYSLDAETYLPAIATANSITANDGAFENWTIPSTASSQVYLRVSDPDYPQTQRTTSISLAPFKFSTPLQGTSLAVGSTAQIRWFSSSATTHVNLAYTLNGGAPTTIASTVQNSGEYSWVVPDLPGVVRIIITDANTPSKTATSSEFTIAEQGISITTPQLNKTIVQAGIGGAGQKQISWAISDTTIKRVIIQATREGVTTTLGSTAYAEGRFTWNKADLLSYTITVRATEFNYPISSIVPLRWSTSGTIERVSLEYSSLTNPGVSTPIASDVVNTGVYDWTYDGPELAGVVVTITGDNTTVATAESAPFAFTNLSLTYPQADSTLFAGQPARISWSAPTTIAAVNLSYSVDGAVWESIANNVLFQTTAGDFSWVVPEALADQEVMVRIANAADAARTDVVSGVQVRPVIGSVFTDDSAFAGRNTIISWLATPSITAVAISYLAEGSTTPVEISASTENDGSFVWSVPSDLDGKVSILVSDVAAPATAATTPTPLLIIGKTVSVESTNLSPTTPLQAGQSLTVHWQNSGAVENVSLSYSTNNFASQTTIAAGVLASAGQFSFTLPDITTSTFRIRIVDSAYAPAVSTTENLSVQRVRVLSPNTAEKYALDEAISGSIYFNAGSIAAVDILLITDEGVVVDTIAASTTATSFSYTSLIHSGMFKIRVQSSSNPSIYDDSDTTFEIGSLVILEPTRTTIPHATPHTISWKASAAVAFVNLYYTTNESDFTLIAPSLLASEGAYSWTVPDELLGSEIWFRVVNVADADEFATTTTAVLPSQLVLTNLDMDADLRVTSTQSITWSAPESITQVNIAYSVDEFVTTEYLATNVSSVEGNNSYSFSVPNVVLDDVAFRVYAADDESIYGESLGRFSFRRVFGDASQGKNSQYPQIAILNEGGEQVYGVVWRDGRDDNNEIYFAKYNSLGEKVIADLRITNDSASSDYPSIASNGSEFMIVWQDQRFGANPQVMYQRLSAAGTLLGSAGRLTQSAFESRNPVVAYSASSDSYGVVWQDNRTGNNQVFFGEIFANGQVISNDIMLTDDTARARTPQITVDAVGSYYVTYSEDRTARSQIYVQKITADGAQLIAPVLISSTTGQAYYPDISYGGSLGVVWMDNRAGEFQVYFSRLDDNLGVLVPEKTVSTGQNRALSPQLTYSTADQVYSLAWVDYKGVGNSDIYFTRIDAEGNAIDGQLPIISGFSDSTYPFMVPAGQGQYALSWNERDNGEYVVYFSLFYLGKVMQFEVIARPEKRVGENFAETFSLDIRRSGVRQTLRTATTPVSAQGTNTDTITYGDLDDGITYDVSIKSSAHLRKTLTGVSLVSGVNQLDFTNGGTEYLYAGDVDGEEGDNIVTEADLVQLNNNFVLSGEVLDRFDLNKDGVLNAIEYSMVISNLQEVGHE